MNILLTGATGFLGHHLLPALIEKGFRVTVLKRSFSDISRLKEHMSSISWYDVDRIPVERIFSENPVDTIIHLATDYGKKNGEDMERMTDTNIRLPSTLLQSAVIHGVRAFINTDTSTDSQYLLYSATKKAFLKIAEFYGTNYDITFINAILHYMYGEGDDVTKFIPFAIDKILMGEKIEATGGKQRKDFIYVKDVVSAIVKIGERIEGFQDNMTDIEIGSGRSTSLRELIGKIESIAGKKARVEWSALPYRKKEEFNSCADISKAESLLGWKPRVSLDEGLEKTVLWYSRIK